MKPPERKHPDELTLLVHDLNNVFQTLVDVADLLTADSRWAPLGAAVLRSVERGKNIATSIQSGNLQAGSPSTPLETIAATAISFVEDALAAAGRPPIRFECAIEPGIELRGNWAWERVLINLFLNSMRAMPAGGAIRLRAGRMGEDVEIAVCDEGSGIAPEILDRVFEPHVSGSQSSGLGLHIVKTIVTQSGGRVRAANLRGPGAEIVISLPAAQAFPHAPRLAQISSV
jgi:signal transduction histidine kinase